MPGEYRRKSNLTMNTLEQTAAQWAADTRIHDVNVVLVPTDGSDQGKHKMADGLKTYAELSFVEDSTSPTAGSVNAVPFIYVTAGDDATGIYRKVGTANGKNWYRNVDAPGDPDLADPDYSVIWDDPGTGLQWNVTDADAGVLFASTSDVTTPDLATGWTVESGATGPAPSIAGYPGPTVQDVLEQIAARVPSVKQYVAVITQADTDPPEATVIFNTYSSLPVASRAGTGNCTLTLSGAFPADKTIVQVTPRESPGEAQFVFEAVATGNTVFISIIAYDGTNYDGYALNVTITTYA